MKQHHVAFHRVAFSDYQTWSFRPLHADHHLPCYQLQHVALNRIAVGAVTVDTQEPLQPCRLWKYQLDGGHFNLVFDTTSS